MRIYMAGRFARRDEFVGYIPLLEEAGHVNSARWLTDETNMEEADTEARRRFAIIDMEDVAKSDAVIAFTEEPGVEGGSRGGRHVEFGAAIAMNKLATIVGPRENVFHFLPGLERFDTIEEAIEFLQEAQL